MRIPLPGHARGLPSRTSSTCPVEKLNQIDHPPRGTKRTWRLLANPPFPSSSAPPPNASMRYRPRAASAGFPAAASCAYSRTRSSISRTPLSVLSSCASSPTGDAGAFSRRCTVSKGVQIVGGCWFKMWGRDVRPLRSASFARSVTGIGTNTAFSGLGKTPTGELCHAFF